MAKNVFDFVGNLDTLIAVVIGAMLATLGALFAEIIQDRLGRRRRERDAARFFGEILYSIDRMLDVALNSQKIGDPWGSVTQRMFKMALREADIYLRNRERLFELGDTALRARLHAHFVTEIFPLEAIVEYCDELGQIDAELENGDTPLGRAQQLDCRSKFLRDIRQRSLNVLLAERARTKSVCAPLEPIARVSFAPVADADATVAGAIPIPPAPPAAASATDYSIGR